MAEICGDNRFEVIERAKQHLLEGTNIDTSPGEMAVLDSFLFRCWQMGWLDRYDDTADAIMPMTLENAINFLDEIGWRAEHDRIMSTPQWIPCEERLPETIDDVLITYYCGKEMHSEEIVKMIEESPCFDDRVFECPFVDIAWYDEEENAWGYGDAYMPFGMHVIAWMPLPEPYKGEVEK